LPELQSSARILASSGCTAEQATEKRNFSAHGLTSWADPEQLVLLRQNVVGFSDSWFLWGEVLLSLA